MPKFASSWAPGEAPAAESDSSGACSLPFMIRRSCSEPLNQAEATLGPSPLTHIQMQSRDCRYVAKPLAACEPKTSDTALCSIESSELRYIQTRAPRWLASWSNCDEAARIKVLAVQSAIWMIRDFCLLPANGRRQAHTYS